MDQKLDVIQRESNDYTSCPIGHSFRASLQGWGAACQGLTAGGPWAAEDQKDHINILELKTAKLAIFTFTFMHPLLKLIHSQMDNIVDLSHKVKTEKTHSKILSDISKEIWEYLVLKGITITVEYHLNEKADFQS